MYSLESHIMDQCNLNCRDCSHMCPLVPKDTSPVNLDRIIASLIRLNAVGCTPKVFKILGGEPLMHPYLTNYLESFRGVLPQSEIIIWTNGLLLPKMKSRFFENCEQFNIRVKITPYKPSRDSKDIKRIVSANSFIEFDSWFDDIFWKSNLTEKFHGENIDRNYRRCRIIKGRCTVLRGTKLYRCCFPAFCEYLNRADSKLHFDNSMDALDIYSIRNERDLENWLYQPGHFCGYCNAANTDVEWQPYKSQDSVRPWINIDNGPL